MYEYSFSNWLLFFYLYCLLGWIWESSYVSLKSKKWVNRGFLHGPFLPIYGSGAIIVLFATAPVRDNIILVFIFGMIAATILEYFTGAAMERLFHVRYWDYSKDPFNINGYICLECTIVWGIFSILMVNVIHPPIANLIFMIPNETSSIITFVITVFITIDCVISFYEAMDLKETLIRFTENSESIRKMQKRLEVISAFLDQDTKGFVEGVNRNNKEMENRFNLEVQNKLQLKDENKVSKRELIDINLEKSKKMMSNLLSSLVDRANLFEEQLNNESPEEKQKYKIEVGEIKNKIKAQVIRIEGITSKKISGSVNMLRRNPGAITKKYSEALEEMKKLYKGRNKE